ncbi:MAG: tail fiber domain-containing protein, partial [Bacteroidota bacterium]
NIVNTNSGNVGIGTTTPTAKLEVIGGVKIVDGTQGANKVLTSDANGLASWQNAGSSIGWTLSGNTGVTNGNFIGTINNVPLKFKVSNQKSGGIYLNGNTFLGYQAGNVDSSANNSTAIGFQALSSNTSGWGNTATGTNALYLNTTGGDNTAFGNEALLSNIDGLWNTATGSEALRNNTSGTGNTANGASTLSANISGIYNTATGSWALHNNTYGSFNSAFGNDALTNNLSGAGNTALGNSALSISTEGESNTAIGNGSLKNNTIGSNNTANGAQALYNNTEGNFNTADGSFALNSNLTGNNNTAFGYHAGNNITTGSNNLILGSYAVASTATISNQVVLGNSSITTMYCYGAKATGLTSAGTLCVNSAGQIGIASSSQRYKKDIVPIEINTSLLYKLKPVSFTYINDGSRSFGLIAEEVDKVIPQLVFYKKAKEVIPGSTSEEMIPEGVRYENLPTLLLAELQKQHAIIENLQKQIDELKALKNK